MEEKLKETLEKELENRIEGLQKRRTEVEEAIKEESYSTNKRYIQEEYRSDLEKIDAELKRYDEDKKLLGELTDGQEKLQRELDENAKQLEGLNSDKLEILGRKEAVSVALEDILKKYAITEKVEDIYQGKQEEVKEILEKKIEGLQKRKAEVEEAIKEESNSMNKTYIQKEYERDLEKINAELKTYEEDKKIIEELTKKQEEIQSELDENAKQIEGLNSDKLEILGRKETSEVELEGIFKKYAIREKVETIHQKQEEEMWEKHEEEQQKQDEKVEEQAKEEIDEFYENEKQQEQEEKRRQVEAERAEQEKKMWEAHERKQQKKEQKIEQQARKEIEEFYKSENQGNNHNQATQNNETQGKNDNQATQNNETQGDNHKQAAQNNETQGDNHNQTAQNNNNSTNRREGNFEIEAINFFIANNGKPTYIVLVNNKDTKEKHQVKKFEIETLSKEKINSLEARKIRDAKDFYDASLSNLLKEVDQEFGTQGLEMYERMLRDKNFNLNKKRQELEIEYDFSQLYKMPKDKSEKEKIKSLYRIAKNCKVMNLAKCEKKPNFIKRIIQSFTTLKLTSGQGKRENTVKQTASEKEKRAEFAETMHINPILKEYQEQCEKEGKEVDALKFMKKANIDFTSGKYSKEEFTEAMKQINQYRIQQKDFEPKLSSSVNDILKDEDIIDI